MLVLDSDLLTLIQRGAGPEYQTLVGRLLSSGDDVSVTIISFEEQMRGWMAYVARARDLKRQVLAYAKLHELIDDFATRPILDFTDAAAVQFQQIRRGRVRIGTMDLKIAAIALAHDAVLLSKTLRDFRQVPGLNVQDWTQ